MTLRSVSLALALPLALVAEACTPPPAPAEAPTPMEQSNAEVENTPTLHGEDVETCRERILNEGIKSSGAGEPEGSSHAHDAEAARKNKDGKAERAAWFELVQNSPHSPYVPFAYFEFAELFKAEAEADASKLPLAEAAYKEAVKLPAPGNRLYLIATYRLGQIYALEKQAGSAHDAFEHAMQEAGGHSEWDCAVPVAEGAQRKLEHMSERQEEDDESR